MMKSILVAAALCQAPEITNEGSKWTKNDDKAVAAAKVRCESYGGKKVQFCLGKFIKLEDDGYQISCTNAGEKD